MGCSMKMDVVKSFQFEAAHRLTDVPESHKCSRLHGHSFIVEIHVHGDVGKESGWVMDFAEVKKIFRPYYEILDHSYLNDVEGLSNPTSENIARWIWKRLKPDLPGLSQIVVRETCQSGCVFRGEEHGG